MREHFGLTDTVALITCLKNLNVSGAVLRFGGNPETWGSTRQSPLAATRL